MKSEPRRLDSGHLFLVERGAINIMDEEGDDLFTVVIDDDRNYDSVARALVHAYYRGRGVGNACGRIDLASELRRLLGAARTPEEGSKIE